MLGSARVNLPIFRGARDVLLVAPSRRLYAAATASCRVHRVFRD
jgi:hypothetical protein